MCIRDSLWNEITERPAAMCGRFRKNTVCVIVFSETLSLRVRPKGVDGLRFRKPRRRCRRDLRLSGGFDDDGVDGVGGLFLLLPRRDGCRPVAFLRTVVAEARVVAAGYLYHERVRGK